MSNVMVTGATGFVGKPLVKQLESEGHCVFSAGRTCSSSTFRERFFEINLAEDFDIKHCLRGVDIVVHSAARAHVLNDKALDPLLEYKKVNTFGSLKLAQQAAQSGVSRFIYISSIKAMGEKTDAIGVFSENTLAVPEDCYGISKYEAEELLKKELASYGMDLVIVRPPLVYGPNVKGNFALMLNLLSKGVPLPLGAVKNKRSFLALDNLIDFVITCIHHPAAANQTFLVSDGQDLSTPELLQLLAEGMGKKAKLLSVPPKLLSWAAKAVGKEYVAQRLLGSLQVDISKAKRVLDWHPPYPYSESLVRTAAEYSSIDKV